MADTSADNDNENANAANANGFTVAPQDVFDPESMISEEQKTIFATSLVTSLAPYKIVMQILFRFPIICRKDKRGHYEFLYQDCSLLSVGFIATGGVVFIMFLLYAVNLWGILVNVPQANFTHIQCRNKTLLVSKRDVRAMEMYILQRNLVPILTILAAFITASVGNISMYNLRHFECEYLTFWTTAVEQLRIDAAYGLATKMVWFVSLYILFLVILLIFSFVQFAPVTTGTLSVYTLLLARVFERKPDTKHHDEHDPIYLMPAFGVIRAIVGVTILYVFINSKCFIMLYYWNCKLLKNSFSVWNNRLERVIHRGEALNTRIEKVANRTGYDHLFKDHCCLLDLIEGTDHLFVSVMNSFYSTQIVVLCFEFFHAWRSQDDKNQFPGARKFDGIVLGVNFIQTLLFLILISLAASSVSHEAIGGLEIIRRKGLLGHKDEDELQFMMSMYVSYTGHFDTGLTAGGYATMNKEFLVALFGTIISYFIVLFQFTPSLVFQNEFLMENLISNGSKLNVEYVLKKSEGSHNPYDNGKTYTLEMDRFVADVGQRQNMPFTWDMFHPYNLLSFPDLSS